MKRIKKGEPADYEGYKKELTARVKTHLTRINKSIKSYSKILKKKSRKPLKKKSVKKSRKPLKKKSVKKSVKKFRTKTYQQHRGKLFMLSTKQKNLNRLKAMKGRNLRKTQKKIEARIREKRAVIRKQQQQHVELISKMKALNVGHENTTGDITSSLGRMSLKT
jgi:hypothetical protein